MKIIIARKSGTGAGTTQTFELEGAGILTLGREATQDLTFSEEIVSREHASVSLDTSDPRYLLLTDRKATNGSFVNGKKVTGAVRLSPGDVVQLGANGPSFSITTDPAPAAATTEVRIAPPTTEVGIVGSGAPNQSGPAGFAGPSGQGGGVKAGIGQHTMQTEIKKAKKSTLAVVLIPIAILAVVAAGAFYVMNQQASKQTAETRKKIEEATNSIPPQYEDALAAVRASVARINASFTLSERRTNKPYVLSRFRGQYLFLRGANEDGEKVTVPLIVTEDSPFAVQGTILSFEMSGSGFPISSNELVTNKHVAETWKVGLPTDGLPQTGLILELTAGKTWKETVGAADLDRTWKPEDAQYLLDKFYERSDEKFSIKGKSLTKLDITGGLVTYEVTFEGRSTPIMGSLVSSSPEHDISILSVPGIPVPPLKILDRHEDVRPGLEIFVVGNPTSAPGELLTIRKADRGGVSNVRKDNPVAVKGTVANILEVGASRVNEVGEAYSLSLSSGAGPGMSGGPLCDMEGNVIGVFYRGNSGGLFFAVPIRFAEKTRATSSN